LQRQTPPLRQPRWHRRSRLAFFGLVSASCIVCALRHQDAVVMPLSDVWRRVVQRRGGDFDFQLLKSASAMELTAYHRSSRKQVRQVPRTHLPRYYSQHEDLRIETAVRFDCLSNLHPTLTHALLPSNDCQCVSCSNGNPSASNQRCRSIGHFCRGSFNHPVFTDCTCPCMRRLIMLYCRLTAPMS
jgi:hypothetical protein